MADDYKDIVARYKARLEGQLGPSEKDESSTKEYKEFRAESMPTHAGYYEKACKMCGSVFKPGMAPDKKEALQQTLSIAHLNLTPEEASSFAIVVPILIILAGASVGYAFNTMFFGFAVILLGLILLPVLNKVPYFMANSWRLKASNQMVQCVFFVVTFMRHTSNLELAVRFAAEHLTAPLSLDMKKVLYDVEIGAYDSIQESLEVYLQTWRQYNPEFIESMHMIMGSLLEGDEKRRVELLDKALDIMLTETYEKMLHYAHNLKSPITTLHMLGVILPILGLVILPLVVSFMETVRWYHIFILYNIALPIGVYYLAKNILSTRPTGYGESEAGIEEEKPSIMIGKKRVNVPPLGVAVLIGVLLLLVAFIPIIIHEASPLLDWCVELGGDKVFYPITTNETGFKASDCGKTGWALMEWRQSTSKTPELVGKIIGPYGLGASTLSIFFPLAAGIAIGMYFKLRTKGMLEKREKAKRLEDEFAAALFQLGNRLADGMPAEAAVGRVAEVMENTISGTFFDAVSNNIRKLGLGLRDALFHPRIGAVNLFPSAVIESSMKVLTESIRKGPLIASQSLQNVSRYIKEIHQVNERLRDLMADIVSDITSQINFMAPAIAGIVIGITSMITSILGKLTGQIGKLSGEGGGMAGGAQLGPILAMFGDGIPTYYFQLVVGLYVVEIIIILSVMSNGIENGADSLGERNAIGKNTMRSTLLYCGIAMTVMIIFNSIANAIVGNK